MPSRRERLLLTSSALVTATVAVGWVVVRTVGDDGSDPVRTGPAPTMAERVQTVEGEPGEADPDWVAETAERHRIPVRAMQAYAAVELAADDDLPACNLRWNTIAGIGSVESAHGTLGGASLDADGAPDRPIIGPALDGTNGTRAIESTPESEQYHGDEEWDHAVGPFQFLTSSWERYGADGDGDGVADPTDIDDAARGAANHLCLSVEGVERNLEADGWVPAVFSYNNSMAYVAKVRDIASSYAG